MRPSSDLPLELRAKREARLRPVALLIGLAGLLVAAVVHLAPAALGGPEDGVLTHELGLVGGAGGDALGVQVRGGERHARAGTQVGGNLLVLGVGDRLLAAAAGAPEADGVEQRLGGVLAHSWQRRRTSRTHLALLGLTPPQSMMSATCWPATRACSCRRGGRPWAWACRA